MREWAVSGGLIQATNGLLLVENRRRNGSVDWSPPGGVVDEGEGSVEALTREVREETGLIVERWAPLSYEIDVTFVDAGMHLRVESYQAIDWSGAITVDDPDGIVEQVEFCSPALCINRLAGSPAWVREPVMDWLADTWTDGRSYAYRVTGTTPATMQAQRL
ncbi:MAG: NUDIX hydrolase [Acidimicrobiales bacterium]|nr:NUDIX hydrolase [Acidimicrobiales bacterium]